MSIVPKVDRILSVSLGVRDLSASETFYETIWGMRRTHAENGKTYFGARTQIITLFRFRKQVARPF